MINIEFLRSQGYITIEPVKRKMTHEEVRFNLYGYFEHYPKFDFWFVQYPDERVEVSRDNIEGNVFGKCKLGYFLEDINGVIRLIAADKNFGEDEGLTLPDLIQINKDIQKFYKCYMVFLAAVYYLKSQIFDSNEFYMINLEKTCKDLQRRLAQINDNCVSDDSFWGLLIYMLEDSYFPISLHLWDYTQAGKIDY